MTHVEYGTLRYGLHDFSLVTGYPTTQKVRLMIHELKAVETSVPLLTSEIHTKQRSEKLRILYTVLSSTISEEHILWDLCPPSPFILIK